MRSVHRPLDIFTDLKLKSGRSIAFISEATPSRTSLYSWIRWNLLRQVAYQSIKSIDMAMEALRARDAGAIVIFEHKPQYSLLLYLVCAAKRVPVFFFSHGIQQASSRSIAHRLGFQVLQCLVRNARFFPIHLELDDRSVPRSVRYSHSLTLLHPLPPERLSVRMPIDVSRVRLGIVGMLRPDKPVKPLIDELKRCLGKHPQYSLRIGTPAWQLSDEVRGAGIEIVDTTRADDYASFLASCDIVVADFDRDSYYFRPSGIINDAAASGCFVIAPDFPVFDAQVSSPCRVGATFDKLPEIGALVDSAVCDLLSGRVDFDAWRRARSGDHLQETLGAAIERAVQLDGARRRRYDTGA